MDTTNARVDDFTTFSFSTSVDQLPLTIHTFSENSYQRTISFNGKTLHQIKQLIETCNALPVLKKYTLFLVKSYEDQIQMYRQFLYNLWRNNICCSLCYNNLSRISTKHTAMNSTISNQIENFLNQDMESDIRRQVVDIVNLNSYQMPKVVSKTSHSPFRLKNTNHLDSLQETAHNDSKTSCTSNWTTFLLSYLHFVSCAPKTFTTSI